VYGLCCKTVCFAVERLCVSWIKYLLKTRFIPNIKYKTVCNNLYFHSYTVKWHSSFSAIGNFVYFTVITSPDSSLNTHAAMNTKLETWTNAQRDGRRAKYRWRPLLNAAKFGWRPLLECRAVTLTTRKPLKFAGVPQTRQQISAASRLTFTILWRCGGDIAV